MSKLTDLAWQCAVTCQKSDNMRASASKLVCDVVAYLKTSEGIMEAHAAGVPPTVQGFHQLVRTVKGPINPEGDDPVHVLPNDLWSFRSFQRLLQIGGDPDVDARLRREQAATARERRQQAREQETAAARNIDPEPVLHTPPDAGANCNNDIGASPVEAAYDILCKTLKIAERVALVKRLLSGLPEASVLEVRDWLNEDARRAAA
jgi:hypothetical protein